MAYHLIGALELKEGDIVLYHHRGKHRLEADRYFAEGQVIRVGSYRVTIRLTRTGQTKVVAPDNLAKKLL